MYDPPLIRHDLIARQYDHLHRQVGGTERDLDPTAERGKRILVGHQRERRQAAFGGISDQSIRRSAIKVDMNVQSQASSGG